MNYRKAHTLIALVLSTFAFLGAQLTPSAAEADSNKRVVLLDIPGGGTDTVVDELEDNDELTLERQDWFLSKIQELDLKPKGIMKRPEDVRKLMKGGNIDYIMYMEPSDETYRARVVDKSGEPTHDFEIERATDGLTEVHAVQVRKKFNEFLESERSDESDDGPKVAQLDEDEEDEEDEEDDEKDSSDESSGPDPNLTRAQASQDDADVMEALSEDWLSLSGKAYMLRRDLSFSGTNDVVLSYASAPYFGFGLNVEAFPLGSQDVDYADAGFYADFVQGFDSANVGEDGAPRSINHLELEGGVIYQIGSRLEAVRSADASMQVSLGLRHSRFGIENNPSLPSLSHSSLVVGASAKREAFTEGLELQFGADFIPLGIYGENGELFGESSRGYGFGSNINALYYASDEIALTLGYDFRFYHTIFEGEGERNFEQATGLELVQGLTGGLLYLY